MQDSSLSYLKNKKTILSLLFEMGTYVTTAFLYTNFYTTYVQCTSREVLPNLSIWRDHLQNSNIEVLTVYKLPIAKFLS